MPRGGARPNAGRKKGSVNRNSSIRAAKAAKTGILPADVLLEAMRYHHARAQTELRKPKPKAAIVKAELALAGGFAKDAAPYYHSRLATLQTKLAVTGKISLLDLVMQSIPSAANSNTPAEVVEGVEETAADA